MINNDQGNNKAVEYILASLLHHKKYVNERINYRELLEEYGKYLDIIDMNLPLSSIFDLEGANDDKLLLNIINYNFSLYENVEERYFNECLWLVAEEKLRKRQVSLNLEFKTCEDLEERTLIAKKLMKVTNDLKNKNLEVFNVRREN